VIFDSRNPPLLKAAEAQATDDVPPNQAVEMMAIAAVVSAKAGATCAVVAIMMGLACAAHGGGLFAGLDLGGVFGAIWSN